MNLIAREVTANRVPIDDYDLRTQHEKERQRELIFAMAVNDHATKLEQLHMAVADMQAFMLWVDKTYPDIFQQYDAIKNLERASNE